ncbi:MAG: DUF2235 domain-containing protein [Pigmentiphaga sp.]|nr:DUF2235 domain-containing protein [Pigmentiphaga sp.]
MGRNEARKGLRRRARRRVGAERSRVWVSAAWAARIRAAGAVVVALVLLLASADAMEPSAADWSCGPPALGAPCPQGGPATLPLGDGTPSGLGNPVSLTNGHKYQREVDWHAYAGELGLEVVRHYHSADLRDTGLGRGWRLSYDTRLYPVGRGWQIVQADGSRLVFAPPGAPGESCRAVGADAGELRPQLDGGYLWQWPTGRQLRFNAQGRLVEIRTAGGAALSLHYGAVPGRHDFGRLLRVRDPHGREMLLHYRNDRLAEIELPDGRLQYWHTAARQLRGVAYPSGRARLYAYEAGHQGGQAGGEPDLAGARITATWWWDPMQGLLPRWAWSYDEQGRVVAVFAGGRRSGRHVALHYPASAEAWQVAITAGPATHTWRPHDLRPPPAADAGLRGIGKPRRLSLPSVVAGRRRYLEFDWSGPADFAAHRPGLPWRVVETGWRPPDASTPALPVRREWSWERTAPAPAPPQGAEAGTGWQLTRRGPPVAVGLGGKARGAMAGGNGWPGLRIWRDDLGGVWRWSSAVTGRFVREPVAHDASAEAWHFANKDVWTFHFDAHGLLRQWLRRSGQGSEDRVNIIPAPGRLRIEHSHENQDWIFPADEAGLARRRIERPALSGAPAWHYEESFRLDAAGRILSHELPEGGQLEYLRDTEGRLRRITWLPPAGPARVLYQQTATGLLLANGSRVGSVFQEGRLVFLWQSHHGRPLLAHRRTYDADGRPSHESIRVAGGAAMHRGFGYDAAGRLAVVATPGGTEWRAWEASGEARARQTRGEELRPPGRSFSATREVDGADALARGQSAGGLVARRDPSGLPLEADGWRLRYGADRRLAEAEQPGGPRVRYFRNAFGELIGRDDGQDMRQMLYVGHQRVAEWGWRRGAWGVLRRLVLADELPVAWIEYGAADTGRGAMALAAQDASPVDRGRKVLPGGWVHGRRQPDGRGVPASGPDLFTLHADAMGIPLAATDDAGRLRWSADVDAWGRRIRNRGALDPALRLPGQWADPLTGWHDNYQRTYHPEWGHYLEPDPAGPPGILAPGMGSDTAYGYAGHQPRRWLDPTGLVLFAFDGTLQSAASGANVYRLSLWYRDQAAIAAGLQSAYYEAGPGGWPMIDLDAAVGWSADRILQTQWDRLLRHLSAFEAAPDPVALDLLGYSRGAALARHFANLILGKVRQGRFWDWDHELGTVTACVDTRFLGLFDTVAQFGVLGARNDVFDFTVDSAWRGVAHAVALHERRSFFPLLSIDQIGQAWPEGWAEQPFIGAHGDIGGGLLLPTDLAPDEAALSDVSLRWMAEQAEAVGLWLDRNGDPLAAGAWSRMHDFRTPVQRLAGWQRDSAGGPLPGVPASDRAVRHASGAAWLPAQGEHPRYGAGQRLTAETLVQRTERWLGDPDPAVARVDLAAYESWLAGLPR